VIKESIREESTCNWIKYFAAFRRNSQLSRCRFFRRQREREREGERRGEREREIVHATARSVGGSMTLNLITVSLWVTLRIATFRAARRRSMPEEDRVVSGREAFPTRKLFWVIPRSMHRKSARSSATKGFLPCQLRNTAAKFSDGGDSFPVNRLSSIERDCTKFLRGSLNRLFVSEIRVKSDSGIFYPIFIAHVYDKNWIKCTHVCTELSNDSIYINKKKIYIYILTSLSIIYFYIFTWILSSSHLMLSRLILSLLNTLMFFLFLFSNFLNIISIYTIYTIYYTIVCPKSKF